MTSPSARPAFDPGQPEPLLWTLALAASIASFQTSSAAVAGLRAPALLAMAIVLPLGLLAGLHRPFGSRGLGALAAPLALASLGCGWGPIALALGAGLSQSAFDRRRDELSARRSFAAAARAMLGATGAFWATHWVQRSWSGGGWSSLVAGTATWLAITAAVDAWLAPHDRRPAWHHVPRWSVESAAWGLGTGIQLDGSAGLALALGAAWAEAGRQALSAARSGDHVRALLASAATDPTTGLLTTQGWRQALDRHYWASRADGSHVAVAIFDLDELAGTNCLTGFASGDERLRDLARQLPPGEASGRWFGGSASWAISTASGQEALAQAEHLRASFDADPRGTVSCGLASTAELATHDAEDLLALAEGALRVAKQQGGARTLLDLGGGRYLASNGAVVETEIENGGRGNASAPPFFA